MQFELFGLKVGVKGVKQSKHGYFVIARIQDLLRVNLDSFCVEQADYTHKWSANHCVIVRQRIHYLATGAACGHVTRNGVRNWSK